MLRRGFTLLEVVLAIGLSGAVIALLTTAIDQYLVRVDASRSQTETAQLARTLMNLLADDIRAARYGTSEGEITANGDGSEATTDGVALGIFGTVTDLRIDRSAICQWDLLARQRDVENANAPATLGTKPEEMPQTVRYYLGDGKELLTAELAAQGVAEQPIADGYAGLYRQQLPTAAWVDLDASAQSATASPDMAEVELIAPEVVSIEFAYYDGQELLTEWDSDLEESLPTAIEIRMTLLEEPLVRDEKMTLGNLNELRRSEENLVEYRRFVLLTRASEPYEADFPQQAQAPEEGQP